MRSNSQVITYFQTLLHSNAAIANVHIMHHQLQLSFLISSPSSLSNFRTISPMSDFENVFITDIWMTGMGFYLARSTVFSASQFRMIIKMFVYQSPIALWSYMSSNKFDSLALFAIDRRFIPSLIRTKQAIHIFIYQTMHRILNEFNLDTVYQ
ncbi:Hypothetical_protein [Hexamita inflata]|uniref:Hypothetical_protein n=1 Tax=Hexamita inflata TaxID=28002 RepID=A0AA86P7N6_9EUKA|nr:Hypothetical protein HINF_LOCUS20863 [Hexamita inflata]